MLEVKDVNQFYGGSHILRDVSFQAPVGECSVVLGRNGVGKTTLLKCLMGILPIKSGHLKNESRATRACGFGLCAARA